MTPRYAIKITSDGHCSLRSIQDKKAKREIREAIDGLASLPESQGKELEEELAGYRSIAAYRKHYRIVYTVVGSTVWVVWVDRRKPGREDDVYAKVQKLVRTFFKKR